MSSDAEITAHERSRATWDEMATGWETEREPQWAASRPVGAWLVEKLEPKPGDTVLELAAGIGDTGFMAARLIGETGHLISTDFAPRMVAAARRRAAELGISNAEFRLLDAERMDLATDSVDGVLCRWGYMLMIDPRAAFAETRRVLRPGGRLALSVWAGREHNPWASLAGRILVERGHLAPPDPTAPGIFALSDPDRLRALLLEAGFAEPLIEEVPTRRRFVDADAFWRYLIEQAGALSPALRGLSSQHQTDMRARLYEAAAPFTRDDGGYDFPGLCLNAVTT
jgi:SAM-dependent methyltransferase